MSLPSKRILVADDDTILRHLLHFNLEQAGYEAIMAVNGREAISFAQGDFACALIDIMMPGLDGMSVLYHFREQLPDVPVIMISSITQPKAAVQAIKSGAFAYVCKPFELGVLMTTVESAVRMGRMLKENRAFKDAYRHPMPESDVVGNSTVTAQIMETVRSVASSDSAVLITGESGVGKSFLAHLIHKGGKRAEKPFFIADCLGLPRELLDLRLFGRDSGTVKNDPQRSLGFFEATGDGTLFLDEVGHLPPLLQPKVMKVLQERRFTRIGGIQTVSSDCRLIASTRFNLDAKVAAQEFQRDLFEHLKAVHIHVPPLRERLEDLPALCRLILGRIARSQSKEPLEINQEAMDLMRRYPWPGNVRELETVLERVSVHCMGSMIEERDLRRHLVSRDS